MGGSTRPQPGFLALNRIFEQISLNLLQNTPPSASHSIPTMKYVFGHFVKPPDVQLVVTVELPISYSFEFRAEHLRRSDPQFLRLHWTSVIILLLGQISFPSVRFGKNSSPPIATVWSLSPTTSSGRSGGFDWRLILGQPFFLQRMAEIGPSTSLPSPLPKNVVDSLSVTSLSKSFNY